jgi:uncharacterized protein YjbJ (UPF0337 family)
MNNEIKIGKDKVAGKAKEAAGKWMKDDELEFEGKTQSIKADVNEKVENFKDDKLRRINDFIDLIKDDKKSK